MHFVYALTDPRNDQIGYIGITEDMYRRYHEHVMCREKTNKYKFGWIRELKSINLIPGVKILETVTTERHARIREKYWITYYLESGVYLANIVIDTKSPARDVTVTTRKFNPDKFRRLFVAHVKARGYRSVHDFTERNKDNFHRNPLARALTGTVVPKLISLHVWCKALECTSTETAEIVASIYVDDEEEEGRHAA